MALNNIPALMFGLLTGAAGFYAGRLSLWHRISDLQCEIHRLERDLIHRSTEGADQEFRQLEQELNRQSSEEADKTPEIELGDTVETPDGIRRQVTQVNEDGSFMEIGSWDWFPAEDLILISKSEKDEWGKPIIR